jgi:23S rRNA pseudouridine1911/1915/1917 synthase
VSELEILYEDNHLLIVNKKASDIVQGDKTGDETMPDKNL